MSETELWRKSFSAISLVEDLVKSVLGGMDSTSAPPPPNGDFFQGQPDNPFSR